MSFPLQAQCVASERGPVRWWRRRQGRSDQGRPTGSGTAKAAGWRRSGCWPGGEEGWSSCRCRPGATASGPETLPTTAERADGCLRRATVAGAGGGVPLARRIRRSRWTGWSCTRDPYSRSLAVAGHDPEPLTMPDHRGRQTTGPLGDAPALPQRGPLVLRELAAPGPPDQRRLRSWSSGRRRAQYAS